MLLTLLVVVLLLGLSAVGVAIAKPDLLAKYLPTSAAPSALWQPQPTLEPVPGPVLAALGGGLAPSADGVRKALEPLLAGSPLGSDVSISVVDVATGEALYSRDADILLTPASNIKIVTAAAVLATRGPAYRITTQVVAGANPGEVVLIGAGDATLAIDGKRYYDGAARLDRLAEQVKLALGDTVPTKVIIDGSLYSGPQLGPDWNPNAPSGGYVSKITALMVNGGRKDPKDHFKDAVRYDDPEAAAGQAFAKLLGLPAGAVSKGVAPAVTSDPATQPSTGSTEAPAAGTVLGQVQSAPMLRQVEQMLNESDNTLAEALARQVALARDQPASFAGAATAVTQVIADLGLPAGQSEIADGSGYSTRNKLSASALTALLTSAADGRLGQLAGIFNGLPVAGWSGTMDYRFAASKQVHGRVRAKSGTLEGINSIAGMVQTVDGRLLAFAVLADNVPILQLPAQDELDRIVAALATCGCP